jgi:hypothetical protein
MSGALDSARDTVGTATPARRAMVLSVGRSRSPGMRSAFVSESVIVAVPRNQAVKSQFFPRLIYHSKTI